MQLGSWHTGDFDGNGYTDLFHAWGGDYAIVWLGQASGVFTTVQHQPWPGYGTGLGQWKVGDFNGDGKSDLLHLWGPNNINTWLATTPGHFNVFSTTMPWGGYGVQQGHWLAAELTNGFGTDLVHICCANSMNVWRSLGNGQFSVVNGWQVPGNPAYGMLDGSWYAADFTGDGKVDLHHACCSNYSNTFVSTWTQTGGTFNRFTVTPPGSYCMLC
jgi:hypothetical protein